jgi:hypothetical protein
LATGRGDFPSSRLNPATVNLNLATGIVLFMWSVIGQFGELVSSWPDTSFPR